MSKQKKVKHHKKGTQPVDTKFKEVSMETFLKWPWQMQLQYCAMRDMDSAEHADTEEERDWYQQRAQAYLDDLAAGKGQSEEAKG